MLKRWKYAGLAVLLVALSGCGGKQITIANPVRVTSPVPTTQQEVYKKAKSGLDAAVAVYRTTFQAIGDAQRAGIVDAQWVSAANTKGRVAQKSLKTATDGLAAYLKLTDPSPMSGTKLQADVDAARGLVDDVKAFAQAKGVKP